MSGLDAVFEKLKSDGMNTVKNIVEWMTKAKIVNDNFTEQQAKKMFDASDETKVELGKFKDVVGQIATQQKKSFESLAKQLQDNSGQMMQQLASSAQAGVSALKNAFK